MSSALEIKETEFALKVRRALDEGTEDLPRDALERLADARRAALARKKAEPVRVAARTPVFAPTFAGAAASAPSQGGTPERARRRASRFRLLWPLLALIAGLAAIAYWEDQQRLADLADIDAAMLTDELPLSAYLDHGFHTYLSHTH
jgi:hypothetical protein